MAIGSWRNLQTAGVNEGENKRLLAGNRRGAQRKAQAKRKP